MKFIMKSLIEALHKPRSMYRPAIFLRQSSKRGPSQNKRGSGELGLSKVIIGIALFPGFAYFGYQMYQLYYDVKKEIIVGNIKNKLKQVSNVTERKVGEFKEGLPFYSVGEISKHNSMDSRVWITYRQGVYDITDFIKLHPGGRQILKAAGSTVAPFFHIYPVHQTETVYTILESYRIGNLQADDLSERADDDDPYSRDPVRHAALHAIVNKPFNGGTDPALLVQSFYTPNELFYVRNHLYVPDLDPATYKFELQVEGESQSYTFTLDDIKKMPKHTVNGALMCIGNRRTEMLKVKPMTGVVHWNNSAISCASWTGVRLRDVLKIAGVDGENEKHKHVHFEGYDHDISDTHFAGSIPIWRAVDKRTDVLLAYEMNGEPLPRDHGFPLRLYLPGVAGVRNVKWIAKIFVSEKESTAHWYQNEYKGFSPNTDWHNVDFSSAPAAQEIPVTSSICSPADGDTVEVIDGYVTFKGYAWSGNGNRIIRVDITPDGGKTWLVADLDQLDTAPPQHWTWTLWSINIPVGKLKEMEVWAKAVDSCYNSQPESFENIYNFRGVMNNAYPRVKVKLKNKKHCKQ